MHGARVVACGWLLLAAGLSAASDDGTPPTAAADALEELEGVTVIGRTLTPTERVTQRVARDGQTTSVTIPAYNRENRGYIDKYLRVMGLMQAAALP